MDTGETAQDAYRRMLREHVAPALRELGFRRGSSAGAFRYETGTHAAEIRFQKSRYSTREEVDFWVLVHASDIKPEFTYFDRTLTDLSDAWPPTGRWTIRAGDPVGPVGQEVTESLRTIAWPAIQAALETPAYPPDRAAGWARTFPKLPKGPWSDDEVAAERQSREALEAAEESADTDPRAFQALLALLESDPDPEIRHEAAWWLLNRAGEERCRRALQAAATEDEDAEVRWIARYALRLV
jgi:hypothetical protein